jgi:uncharacterized membrane protein
MDWDRVGAARARARFLLAIPWIAFAFLAFAWLAAPSFTEPSFGPTLVLTLSGIQTSRGATGIPIDAVPLVVGVFGMLFGFAWMWKLYRAPTKSEGAHWRFHDH